MEKCDVSRILVCVFLKLTVKITEKLVNITEKLVEITEKLVKITEKLVKITMWTK